MSAPNIVQLSSIYGTTSLANVSTVASDLVVNNSSSGKVLKINTLIIANIDGSSSANVTASVYRGSVPYAIISSGQVDAGNNMAVLTKDKMVYLEEGDSIRIEASANGDLQAICSYEDIS